MASDTYLQDLRTESSTAGTNVDGRQDSQPIPSERLFGGEFFADACTCIVVMFAVCLVHVLLERKAPYSLAEAALFCGIAGGCCGFLFRKRQKHQRRLGTIDDTAQAVRVSSRTIVILIAGHLLLHRGWALWDTAAALLLIPVALAAQRYLLAAIRGQLAGTDSSEDPRHVEHLVESLNFNEVTQFYVWIKRAFDLFLSTVLLAILSPILLLLALVIRITSRGPALFVQERVGIGGVPFKMYKFRSMKYESAQYECSPITSSDPRITWVGRLLRRTSLDELPQLINVFLGHMSLVGPRPEMPFIVDRYDKHQRLRLRVTPGITGLWQLSKDRIHPIHENLHHDLKYIRERSLPLDLAILIHTLLFAMKGGV